MKDMGTSIIKSLNLQICIAMDSVFLEFLQELHGGNTAISSDCSIFTIQSNGASIQELMEEIRLAS